MFSNAVLEMLSQQRLPSPGHVRRMEKDRLLKDLFYSQLDLCKRQQSLPHLRYNNSCKMTRTQQTLILAHEDGRCDHSTTPILEAFHKEIKEADVQRGQLEREEKNAW